jgi:hypothetical protein
MYQAGRRALGSAVAFTAALLPVVGAAPCGAQMPGQPVLQNAFGNPGITVAANFGIGNDVKGYGGAAAWAPGSARFQLSAGAGVLDPDRADAERAFAWGARAMVPVLRRAAGALGLAAFAGVGGTKSGGVTQLAVPVGAAVGYRRALGASRVISLYAAPFYNQVRVSGDGGSETGGTFRVSAGLDVALIPALGLTAGYETGATAKDGDPGPQGGVFGVGVSYALRRP